MDKYLNEDAITAEIMSYVKNRIYNYAVLIDGDWGTGKTYFIQKSIIPTLEGSGYMPIYISLYGVNSTDTVSQKIALSILTNKLPSDKRTVAKQCLPAIGSFVLPIGQTLLNATGISILEPFFKSPVEDIPWDTIFKKFNDSRKRIFIFDDLERCSLPINEILGYINSLVEHESEKFLIVANQQAIGKMSLRNDLEAKYQVVLNPQLHLTEKVRDPSQPYYTLQNNLVDQHITEFTPDQLKQHTAELFSENVLYKEIKEKLVGQELYFHPTLKNILPHIIAESSLDEEVKEVLTQSLDKIVYVFQQENCLNLRSFQSALLTFSRIWNLIFNMNINTLDRHSLLETLFIAILHSTIQQKRGGPRFNWPEKRSYQQYSYSKKVLDFARMFVGFKFVEDYVFDSELDCESAISTINSYVQNEITKPRERSFDPIQKAEKYWLMDDLKVEAIYTELSNCIETHNYTLIELFKILSFAHKLSELGFTVDVDQYFHKVYNAINNMEPISKEQMRYFELSMFDGSFLSQDSPCFSVFKQQCNELLALIEKKSTNKDDLQLDNILKEKLHWGHKLYKYVFERRDAFLSERAFLSKFNIDIIVDKLKNSPPDDWQDFRHCLSAVYGFSNLRDYYSNDLKNAIALKEKLDVLVLPTKILNNLHKKWLIADLQEIINKLTPQSPNNKETANNGGSDTTNSQHV